MEINLPQVLQLDLVSLNISLLNWNEASSMENLPMYHTYSKPGHGTDRVVYANYGTVEDFQYLTNNSISLDNTIVMVRAGGGIKAAAKIYNANMVHAKAILIYRVLEHIISLREQ